MRLGKTLSVILASHKVHYFGEHKNRLLETKSMVSQEGMTAMTTLKRHFHVSPWKTDISKKPKVVEYESTICEHR